MVGLAISLSVGGSQLQLFVGIGIRTDHNGYVMQPQIIVMPVCISNCCRKIDCTVSKHSGHTFMQKGEA